MQTATQFVTASKARTNPQFPKYQAWNIYRSGKLIGEIAVLKDDINTPADVIKEYFRVPPLAIPRPV